MKYNFETFTLDSHALTLSNNGSIQKIEPQIYALLELLIKNAGRTVTKSEVIDFVWQGRHISDAAINSRLHAARAIINDDGTRQRLIKTVPNVGLRFVGEVQAEKTVFDSENLPDKTAKHATRKQPFKRGALLLALILPLGFIGLLAFRGPQADPYPASEFVYTNEAAIFGHNTTRIWGLSSEECMRACLEERNFYCKSIDYTRVEKMCDLSDKSAEDVGGLKTDYPGAPHDHYARKNIDVGEAVKIETEAQSKARHELDMVLKSALSLLKDRSPSSVNLAVEQYLMALTLQPNSPEALSGLAEANRLQSLHGSLDKSTALPRLRRIIEKASTVATDHPDVHTAAAAVALMDSNYRQAVEYSDKAIGHRHLHGARIHHYKALALLELGQESEAMEEHKQVLFHEPNFAFLPIESAKFQ